MLLETAEECFERLMQEHKSPKYKKCLELIRKSCNEIISLKGELTFSTVAKYALNHFGGPKYSTIMNDVNGHKLYIGIRMRDMLSNSNDGRKSKKKLLTAQFYPSEDLDHKTKAYIDQLHREMNFYSKLNQTLTSQLNTLTMKNPINFSEAIKAGPDDDLNLILLDTQNETSCSIDISSDLICALKSIINLPKKTSGSVRVDENNALILESPSEVHILLTPKEYQSIESTINSLI